MTMMVLNRNFALRTLKGHSVEFKKNEPVFVPAIIHSEALAIGAELVEGEVSPNAAPDPDAAPKAPLDPAQRDPLILAAIKRIVADNNRKDFTAAGSPTVKAVEREFGFDVDAREVAKSWQVYHDEVAASE